MQYLPFKVADEIYALGLNEIQEVVDQPPIYEFPGSPDVVAGAIGFHGCIVPVIDLPKLLNIPTGNIGQRLIVLINDRGPLALGADQVGSIVNLELSRPKSMENSERKFIREIVNRDGETISLFDLDQLQVELDRLCDKAGG